jgi:hypothetical protein
VTTKTKSEGRIIAETIVEQIGTVNRMSAAWHDGVIIAPGNGYRGGVKAKVGEAAWDCYLDIQIRLTGADLYEVIASERRGNKKIVYAEDGIYADMIGQIVVYVSEIPYREYEAGERDSMGRKIR